MFALAAVPFACVSFLLPAGSLWTAIPFLTLTYGLLNTYYGFVYSAIQDIVAPDQRGTTMAIYFLAMYLGGASYGPLLVGRLSDVLAHRAATLAGSPAVTEAFRAAGLQQALLTIPAFSLALSGVLYAASRTIVADIERRESRASHVVSLASTELPT